MLNIKIVVPPGLAPGTYEAVLQNGSDGVVWALPREAISLRHGLSFAEAAESLRAFGKLGLTTEDYYTALAEQDPVKRRQWLEGEWEIGDGHKGSSSV